MTDEQHAAMHRLLAEHHRRLAKDTRPSSKGAHRLDGVDDQVDLL
jgi:hypothetical protein